MKIALLHDHFDAAHLEAVKAEMLTRGAPVIRAVRMDCYGMWVALEGCHRLRAAAELGLTPEIIEVDYSDAMLSEVGCLDAEGEDCAISSICDDANHATVIAFEG